MANDLDWLLWRGISFKALMALGSNYFQELIEAYVLPCSLCSAEDHPLPAFHLCPAGSQLGAPATLCVPVHLFSHVPEQAQPAVQSGATAKSPYPGTRFLCICSIVTPAVLKATLATGFGELFP